MFDGREWHGKPSAPASDIKRLRAAAPFGLPEEYLQLLSFSNGGEGPLPIQPCYLQLDPVDIVLDCLSSQNYGRADLQSYLLIGSNGGGEYVAFDLSRPAPWPIVYIDMVAGPDTAEVLASDFQSLLEIIGFE